MVSEDEIDFRGVVDSSVGEGLEVGECGVEIVTPGWVAGDVGTVGLEEGGAGELDVCHYGGDDVVVAFEALGVEGVCGADFFRHVGWECFFEVGVQVVLAELEDAAFLGVGAPESRDVGDFCCMAF